MSLKKFHANDVIVNTMEAHPRCEFFIWNGSVYYNSVGYNSGAYSQFSKNVPTGAINLYEYNVDRLSGSTSYEAVSTYYTGGEDPDEDGTPTAVLGPFTYTHPAGVPNTPRPLPGYAGAVSEDTNPFIIPFITKDGDRLAFRTVGTGSDSYWDTATGDILTTFYPRSASITREFILNDLTGSSYGGERFKDNDHYRALRNKLNYLGGRSEHYKISSPDDGLHPSDPGTGDYLWHKDHQRMALISIPSIFHGSQIKPGSVSLRWYMTGTLCGEIRDINQNGELIQVSGGLGNPGFSATAGDVGDLTNSMQCSTGSVAGVVLYDEGFIILTGSWPLTKESIVLIPGATTASEALRCAPDAGFPGSARTKWPRWIYWGVGALDGANSSSMDYLYAKSDDDPDPDQAAQAVGILEDRQFNSASYGLSFEGTTKTQVVTMFAHARRGEVNYSNNPTYLQYNQNLLKVTSSHVYEENPNRLIKNTVSSSFSDYSASFERQVYISRVALYDNNKNLIGVATLGNPIRKKEDEDITFKMRLDI